MINIFPKYPFIIYILKFNLIMSTLLIKNYFSTIQFDLLRVVDKILSICSIRNKNKN